MPKWYRYVLISLSASSPQNSPCMDKELLVILNDFVDIMRRTDWVLGAWNFGSAAHELTDKYSDADVVFLVGSVAKHKPLVGGNAGAKLLLHLCRILCIGQLTDKYSDADVVFLVGGKDLADAEESLKRLISGVCDEVILCWEEDFNSDSIINNGYLLEKNWRIFQFDVFLLSKDRIDDYICKIHYTDLYERDIIFDKDGSVLALAENCPHGEFWGDDADRLIRIFFNSVPIYPAEAARILPKPLKAAREPLSVLREILGAVILR